MFTLVEALRFRSLRYIRQPLGPFHVLVGPNASGKTTFLDAISFLSDLVTEGLDAAIDARVSDLRELCWAGQGTSFEIALEAEIPEEKASSLAEGPYKYFRYVVRIGVDDQTHQRAILYEVGTLHRSGPERHRSEVSLFPDAPPAPETIIDLRKRGARSVFTKKPSQHDNYYPETRGDAGTSGWVPAFRLGARRSTLANLPEDEFRFPVATWFKQLLSQGVQRLILNSLLIRKASPPGQGRAFKPDGSNLPWVIAMLEKNDPGRLEDWVRHLRTALPDVRGIRTVERPEDRHRYLVIQYDEGFDVPSWMVSDGTLRLLALTLPAYLPGFSGVYLIEEPENGLHPRAIESMFQSLSSVYGAQILMATHSPVILSLADAEKVLCFAKKDGATDIVPGDRHPRLRDWKGEENLGVLFAGGVLG